MCDQETMRNISADVSQCLQWSQASNYLKPGLPLARLHKQESLLV